MVGDEPIWCDGLAVGWVTSCGYAHTVKRSVALGYVPTDLAHPSAPLQIEVIGELRGATVQSQPLFDPAGHRMRG